MSVMLIFIAGTIVFSIVTLATLWAGYLSVQRAWVSENSELVDEDIDDIRPLVGQYPELRDTDPS
jgi:hypothetical protein